MRFRKATGCARSILVGRDPKVKFFLDQVVALFVMLVEGDLAFVVNKEHTAVRLVSSSVQ